MAEEVENSKTNIPRSAGTATFMSDLRFSMSIFSLLVVEFMRLAELQPYLRSEGKLARVFCVSAVLLLDPPTRSMPSLMLLAQGRVR